MNITVGGRYMIDGKNVKNNQNAVVSNIGFVPGRGQVAYLPVKEAARRKSGIFVPGAESKTLRIARVVAVGEPTEDDDTSPFTVGDIVAYSGMTAHPLKLPFDDNEYLLSAARNMLGHVLEVTVLENLEDGVTA
jgi:co-chaperonin GroES (HSP10)